MNIIEKLLEVSIMETVLKIPIERIGVLVGIDGKIKKYIEKELPVKMIIDSENGAIRVRSSKKGIDPTLIYVAKNVILAIGRGFSPEHAFRLLHNHEIVLDLIDLRVIFGRSESDIKRVKGRIIGLNGKTRKIIEDLTETNIAVYGHTVGIIGYSDNNFVAKEAIQMLIEGSLHKNVYRYLHMKRREFKKQKLELWKKPNK